MHNLYNIFKRQLLHKTKNIIFTPDNSYSFEEIDIFSARLATQLFNLGVKTGDRVTVQIEKSEYNIFIYLACLRSGFIYVPLNNSYTSNELDYFFRDAEPKIIICDPKNELIIKNLKSTNSSLIKTVNDKGGRESY